MIESKHFVYTRVVLPDTHEPCMAIVAKEGLTKKGKLRKGWGPAMAFMNCYEPPINWILPLLKGLDSTQVVDTS